MGAGGTTRVVVVADLENLRYAARDAAPNRGAIRPTVVGIANALRPHGLEVAHVVTALATDAIAGRPRSRHRSADEKYIAAQEAAPVPSTILRGILDAGEIGVDSLLVAGALHAMRQIGRGEIDAVGVVVLSSDRDVLILHRYPTGVPVLYLGSYSPEQERVVEDEGSTALPLPRETLLEMCGVGAPSRSGRAIDSAWLDRKGDRAAKAKWRRVRKSSVVAVVDAYGLFKRVRDAFGLAELPTAAAVRSMLAVAGLGGPAAVYATVPDIPDHHWRKKSKHQVVRRHRDGWRSLDLAMEALAREFERDGDDSTQVNVSILNFEGDGIEPTEKQTDTHVAADAYWALARTDGPVVLLSDHPSLRVLQENLSALDIDKRRLIYVTLHPLLIAKAPATRAEFQVLEALSDEPSSMMLHEDIARPLMPGSHSPSVARRLLAELGETSDAGFWEVCSFEPDIACARLKPLDEKWRGVTLLLEADKCQIGDRVHVRGVRVSSFSSRGCDVPRAFALRGINEFPSLKAGCVVTSKADGRIGVDIDGDGKADAQVPVGHEAAHFALGATVHVARHRDAHHYLGWRGGVHAMSGALRAITVHSVDSDGSGSGVTEDGATVRIRGGHAFRAVAGARQLAEPVSLEPDTEWDLISTPLPPVAAEAASLI